jgi:hypothetical protein
MMQPVVLKGPLPILPAVCFRCKCYEKEYFVDTGIDTEFDGRIFLCNHCMIDFVKVMPDAYTARDVLLMEIDSDKIKEASSKALRRYDHLLKSLKALGLDIKSLLDREEKANKNERTREYRKSVAVRDSVPEITDPLAARPDPEPDDSSTRDELDDTKIDLLAGQPNAKAGAFLLFGLGTTPLDG